MRGGVEEAFEGAVAAVLWGCVQEEGFEEEVMTLRRLWHWLFGHGDFEFFNSFGDGCRCRCGRYLKDGMTVS